MKNRVIWAYALASVLLANCAIFEQSAEPPDKAAPPAKAETGVQKPKPVPPVKPAPKPPKSVAAPETPAEFFANWIKQDANKAKLQGWLDSKPKAPKDINVFLSEKRYNDMRYAAYFDLVGSK